MLCEVDRSYIEDGFNLYGLRHDFANFQGCLDIILDRTGERTHMPNNRISITSTVQVTVLLTTAVAVKLWTFINRKLLY